MERPKGLSIDERTGGEFEMASIKSQMRREIKKQERRQIREYKKQLRKQGVPSQERNRLVREFKKELRKQRRNVLRNV
jgi:uncharacterized protein YaiI (UPF0178 family)